MKVFSWNVQRRTGSSLRRQVDAAVSREADVLALQEITRGSVERWSEALQGAGYAVLDTQQLADEPYPDPPDASPPSPPHRIPASRLSRTSFNSGSRPIVGTDGTAV